MSIPKISPFQDKFTPDVTLDTCGHACPLPLLKTKQALANLHCGQILWVISQEASLQLDIKVLMNQTQNTLLATSTQADLFHFLILKN
jgi:tRNA 2-thiouridine synthesizing protein A